MADKQRFAAIRLILAPVLCAVLAFATFQLSKNMMGTMDMYKPGNAITSFSSGASRSPAVFPAGARTSSRVLLVVVDGLRTRTSEQMPFLEKLCARGFSGTLRVFQPSFSKPGYAAIASGAGPEVNGVVLNGFEGRMRVDDIFAVAARAGLTTSAAADDWWLQLVGPVVTYPHYYRDADFYDPATDEKAFADARTSLAKERADLTLVHFGWTDVQAHHFGGADSKEYLQAARHIDKLIRGLAAELDLNRDTIIVTADHGHLGHNMGIDSGHGGWEPEVVSVPLVAAGAGIARGQLREVHPSVDLTPTIASLLGLPAPSQSQGRVLYDMLNITPEMRARLSVERATQLSGFEGAYSSRFSPGKSIAASSPRQVEASQLLASARETLDRGDYERAFSQAETVVSESLTAMDTARNAALSRGRVDRIPFAVLFLAVLALTLHLLMRRPKGSVIPGFWITVSGAAVYLGLDILIYSVAMRGTYSLGALTGTDPLSMLRLFAWPAYVAVAVVVVGFWVAARKGTRVERVASVERAVLAAVAVDLLVAGAGLFLNGFSFATVLPDFRVAFVTLAAMLKVTFLALPAILLPVLAIFIPGQKKA